MGVAVRADLCGDPSYEDIGDVTYGAFISFAVNDAARAGCDDEWERTGAPGAACILRRSVPRGERWRRIASSRVGRGLEGGGDGEDPVKAEFISALLAVQRWATPARVAQHMEYVRSVSEIEAYCFPSFDIDDPIIECDGRALALLVDQDKLRHAMDEFVRHAMGNYRVILLNYEEHLEEEWQETKETQDEKLTAVMQSSDDGGDGANAGMDFLAHMVASSSF